MIAMICLIIVCLLLVIASAFKRVPVGQVHSLYRHGQPVRLLEPGVHWVWPLLERIAHRIDLGGQVLRFEEPLADRHDVRGTVYWQVLEPERADAVIEQAAQLIRGGALKALHQERDMAAGNSRDLGGRLKLALNSALRERGMMVTRVELDFA